MARWQRNPGAALGGAAFTSRYGDPDAWPVKCGAQKHAEIFWVRQPFDWGRKTWSLNNFWAFCWNCNKVWLRQQSLTAIVWVGSSCHDILPKIYTVGPAVRLIDTYSFSEQVYCPCHTYHYMAGLLVNASMLPNCSRSIPSGQQQRAVAGLGISQVKTLPQYEWERSQTWDWVSLSEINPDRLWHRTQYIFQWLICTLIRVKSRVWKKDISVFLHRCTEQSCDFY